jgi:hypothetical protein
MWRQMGISEVMSDVVMADIRSQTETAKRLATSVRAQNTPAPSSPPDLLVRQPSLGDMNVGRPLGPQTNNAASSSVLGSILASMDSPKKRKRTEKDENQESKRSQKEIMKKSCEL